MLVFLQVKKMSGVNESIGTVDSSIIVQRRHAQMRKWKLVSSIRQIVNGYKLLGKEVCL